MKFQLQLKSDGSVEALVDQVYAGAVVMPSDQGVFTIQHRDGGIEVSLDGSLLWSSTSGYFPGRGPFK